MKKLALLGGGQLARMMALAGYPLGIELVCFDREANTSAAYLAETHVIDFMDDAAMSASLKPYSIISYETENLPIEMIERLAETKTIFPGVEVIRLTQDRLYEKQTFQELTIPTTKFVAIDDQASLSAWIAEQGFPFVIKTRTGGYDGKGQFVCRNQSEADHAWQALKDRPLIAEEFIQFDREVSIISVRGQSGEIAHYPLTENQHHEGILRYSRAPYDDKALTNAARAQAEKILKQFNYVGVLTIEFFVRENELIANEVAPRVHNSGHWTIEGAVTSQFENHLRAVLGLPLGETNARKCHGMINCIGELPSDLSSLLAIPGVHFHDYQKTPREKRKVGHISLEADSWELLAERVAAVEKL